MDDSLVFVASDHAGFAIKSNLINELSTLNWTVQDLGPDSEERVDYPDFADQVCQKVLTHPGSYGLLICGSGQGMAMRANKYSQIRAALCWNEESAQLAREHNNANVLCVGSRLVDIEIIHQILHRFFSTSFSGGRHQNRVEKLSTPV